MTCLKCIYVDPHHIPPECTALGCFISSYLEETGCLEFERRKKND